MGRSIFGWDLPPGVSMRDIDPPEQPCEVCGHMSDSCICPECHICGEYGNPRCYDVYRHLQENEAQILGRKLREEAEAEERFGESEYYRSHHDDA